MSAAEHTDEHGEYEVFHQAPWVYFATYGACFGFLALNMFAKGKFFAAASIVWLTVLSIPFQIYLAKKQWLPMLGTAAGAVGGYFGLQMLLG